MSRYQATFAVPAPKPVDPVKETTAPSVSEPASTSSPSKRKREDEEPVTGEVSSRKGKKGKKGKKDAEAPVEAPAAQAVESTVEVPAVVEDVDMDQASDAEADESNILDSADEDNEFVHESKKTSSGEKDKGKKQKKQKFVPEEESKTDRDRRTIFIGNLPVETAKSKVRPRIPGVERN